MLVYLRDRSAVTFVPTDTLKEQLEPCYVIQSKYTDTGPTSPRLDPTTAGARQCSQYGTYYQVLSSHWHDSAPDDVPRPKQGSMLGTPLRKRTP